MTVNTGVRTHNRVLTIITFTQQPRDTYPDRNEVLIFSFVREFEITSTWRDLTDKGQITLPKNVFIRSSNGNSISILRPNYNLGGFINNNPLFLRGDKVNIKWGYAYYDDNGNDVAPMVDVFEGYISEVTSKLSFTLKIEDNMYILKQIPCPVKEWVGYTVERMLAEILAGAEMPITGGRVPFTVDQSSQTKIGNFRTGSETVAMMLMRLRNLSRFEAYFRGNELRCGSFVYKPQDVFKFSYGSNKQLYPMFRFQQNIIEDNLNYRRKDDQVLSCVAKNTIEEETGQYTRDGKAKTKKVMLAVLVTFQYSDARPTYLTITPGMQVPPNDEGERHSFTYTGATTIEELKDLATKELRKYYYTGFKGSFTTFGMPFIKHGDNVILIDDRMPEKNGCYKVKQVVYRGGVNGLRQQVDLHYLLYLVDKHGNLIPGTETGLT